MGGWCEAWEAHTQEGAPPQPRSLSKKREAAPSLCISFGQALILEMGKGPQTHNSGLPPVNTYIATSLGAQGKPRQKHFLQACQHLGGRPTQTLEGAPHAGMASGLLIPPPLQLPTSKLPWDWAGGGSNKFREVFRGWKQQPRFP